MLFADVALRLHPTDDVAVARKLIKSGTTLVGEALRLAARQDIPPGHKIALRDIPEGRQVLKYGQIIGFAARPIAAGAHVHSHNLMLREYVRDYAAASAATPLSPPRDAGQRTFLGYERPRQRRAGELELAGTRNYIAVISAVNCSASATRFIVERFRNVRQQFPNVDGVVAFTHQSGCCVQPGEPMEMFQRTIANMARHPNIAAYVLLGLGCETSQGPVIIQNHGLPVAEPGTLDADHGHGMYLAIQAVGGIRKTIDAACRAIDTLLPLANKARRTPQPLSRLAMAMNCGGSDGNSGITANPALGVASDLLVAHSGTSVLAETTEIYGAEHLLTRRAVSKKVAEDLVARIHWWEHHVRLHNATIDNNPTHGNKEGGLTTIYEKSLGAVAKAGQAPLTDVLLYAQRLRTPGLNFMDTPGLDNVSMTGLIAGGCNIAAFTTGRGSCFALKPTPTLKIATNSPLYNHMVDDMDVNAGAILDGTTTVTELGCAIFERLVAMASGAPTKSEAQGLGDEEFTPWVLGPVF